MRLIIIFIVLILSCHNLYANQPSQFKIEEATIDSIHDALIHKQLTCKQLITIYLQRIKQFNLSFEHQAPFNAFTQINPSVLDQAQTLDDQFNQSKKLIGPLHCVPVILKDNIDSFDTITTSGSFALLGNQPTHDSELVSRLRKAGAIILGKGGMDEFAWGMFGISSRNGRIGNAYNAMQNPGGSSGGPAVAVSANFAVVGIGTDNSGSVRIPAAFNGLVGLRPSSGLISHQGIFPMGNLDGTAGPMTRTTKDLALTLDVLINSSPTYVSFLNKNGLQGKRIGIVYHVNKINTFNKMPKEIQKILQEAMKTMGHLGATFIDIDLPKFDNNRDDNQAGEIEDVNEYLAAFPATRKNFRDICESNRTRTFGSVNECFNFIAGIKNKNSSSYQNALKLFSKNKNYIHQLMEQQRLDALLLPISTHGSATYDGNTVNTWRAPVASNAGLPSIAINIGYTTDNMPIGIELVGKQFSEGKLLEIAYAYEQHMPPRHIPILPSENSLLLHLSIPELNILFTNLGANAYSEILKNANPRIDLSEQLSASKFKNIAEKSMNELFHFTDTNNHDKNKPN